MRIATYNVEWFSSLFDENDQLYLDDKPSRRYKTTRRMQSEALRRVFRRIDADVIIIIEAPNASMGQERGEQDSCRALQNFACWAEIRAGRAIMGFANETQQEIALLFDPDVIDAAHTPRATDSAPRFDQSLAIDLDIDASLDEVQFSKPPMELELRRKGSDTALHLIGAHLKSKAPHGARTPAEAQARAIANRRKQLAQAIWLRRRIDALIEANAHLIVAGDLNDGPGLDVYEQLFGQSSVEIVMGADLYDPNAQYLKDPRRAGQPTTARFYDSKNRRYFQALLDYMMVSPALRPQASRWRIWHPFDDPECFNDKALGNALLAASDHFPVTLDVIPEV